MTGLDFLRRREAMGLDRKQLAELLGVAVQTVGRYETGRRNVSRQIERALERIERDHKKGAA